MEGTDKLVSAVADLEASEEASYDSATGSLTLSIDRSADHRHMKKSRGHVGSEEEEEEATDPGEADEYTSALLKKPKRSKNRLCKWCPSYRSADPERAVTPFAVVLLIVLFKIYILNQADRLVLPVAIPTGLRCEAKEEECVNETKMSGFEDEIDASSVTGYFEEANSSSNNTDCIHFNDYEQGLLTGESVGGGWGWK